MPPNQAESRPPSHADYAHLLKNAASRLAVRRRARITPGTARLLVDHMVPRPCRVHSNTPEYGASSVVLKVEVAGSQPA